MNIAVLRAADSGRALVACAGQILMHSLDGTATSTSVAAVSASSSKLGSQSGSHFSAQPSADAAAVPQNLKLNSVPTLTLPPPGAPPDVACLALSQHFLVAGTASGGLWLFRCPERMPVAETRHAGGGIRCVWPQPAGVRRVLPLSDFPTSVLGASPSLLSALPWGWLCLCIVVLSARPSRRRSTPAAASSGCGNSRLAAGALLLSGLKVVVDPRLSSTSLLLKRLPAGRGCSAAPRARPSRTRGVRDQAYTHPFLVTRCSPVAGTTPAHA